MGSKMWAPVMSWQLNFPFFWPQRKNREEVDSNELFLSSFFKKERIKTLISTHISFPPKKNRDIAASAIVFHCVLLIFSLLVSETMSRLFECHEQTAMGSYRKLWATKTAFCVYLVAFDGLLFLQRPLTEHTSVPNSPLCVCRHRHATWWASCVVTKCFDEKIDGLLFVFSAKRARIVTWNRKRFPHQKIPKWWLTLSCFYIKW